MTATIAGTWSALRTEGELREATAVSNLESLWQVKFTTPELPRELLAAWDVVRVPRSGGKAALEALRQDGHRVGPVLVCAEHPWLLIPVPAGTAHRWMAPHSLCRTGRSADGWACYDLAREPMGRPCAMRFWLFPPGWTCTARPLTDPDLLYDHLARIRARLVRGGSA
ncbi:hypothetical protein [Streptomyces sp. SUK 48]|uniref:hypothetical protein n=1 Tax=Streptomyces sp. SUK 48 TaxID=2582831 RepID=UPI00129AF80C|nr:hypothetical protein [Streptomyces sp. SUK 48]